MGRFALLIAAGLCFFLFPALAEATCQDCYEYFNGVHTAQCCDNGSCTVEDQFDGAVKQKDDICDCRIVEATCGAFITCWRCAGGHYLCDAGGNCSTDGDEEMPQQHEGDCAW